MPVKWTAPEVLFGHIAKLSSKSDVCEPLDQIKKWLFFFVFVLFVLFLFL